MKTTILTIEDIISIVNNVGLNNLMDQMIDRLEQGLLNFDEKRSQIPPRSGFKYDEPDTGLLEWMPVLTRGRKTTIKLVGYHPTNPDKRNLPTIISSINVFDTTNGHLIALSDATFLTALRTGAASAVASKIMGQPDSKIIGLIGCGAQAVTQLHGLSRVFEIEKVLIYDIDPLACKSFISRAEFLGLDIRVSVLDGLVARSDIISSATSVEKGQGPVFQDSAVRPWLHINAVGSDFPGKIEIPIGLLKRSFVFPDFPDQAIAEGECQQLNPNDIGPSLTRIVQQESEFHRFKKKLSVFDSTGWALQDQLAMEILMGHADALGLGTKVQIESWSSDPKNPYAFFNLKAEGMTNNRSANGYRKQMVSSP